MRQIISDIEEGRKISIYTLQAMRMADKVWNGVTKQIIATCFRRYCFHIPEFGALKLEEIQERGESQEAYNGEMKIA